MRRLSRVWLALPLLAALVMPVRAATITITGTITDANGSSATFGPITVTTDTVVVTSAVVTPLVAPLGTLRTLTVAGTSSAGLALTATVNAVNGITFAPVAGQPAGTFQWTFVY